MLEVRWLFLIACCAFTSADELYNNEAQNALRIVGTGAVEVTDLTPYPWLVGIVRNFVNNGLIGSGVIVGKWWVLASGTTGQTIRNHLTNASYEHYVRSDKVDISLTGSSYRRRITAVTVHSGYTNSKRDNNLAVIRVCPYFQDGRAATLGPASPVAASQTGTVLGWGGTNLKKLKSLAQTVDSDANCAVTSASAFYGRVYDAAQNFCVIADGNGLCVNDDWGGPFIMSGRVVGILDELSCAVNGTDTYTELSATYIAWVNAQMI